MSRVSVQQLADLVFSEKQADAVKTKIGKSCGFPSYNAYPLKAALDLLEYYTNKSKAKCLSQVRNTWRAAFETSEACRRLKEEDESARKEKKKQWEDKASRVNDLLTRMQAIHKELGDLKAHKAASAMDDAIEYFMPHCREATRKAEHPNEA